MTVETLRHFFAWCAVINFAMLMLWFFLYLAAHSWMTGLAQRFFNMSAEKYDSMSCKGMLFYKLGIFMFNIAPYLALRIMGN
jgi:hypothetical protein